MQVKSCLSNEYLDRCRGTPNDEYDDLYVCSGLDPFHSLDVWTTSWLVLEWFRMEPLEPVCKMLYPDIGHCNCPGRHMNLLLGPLNC